MIWHARPVSYYAWSGHEQHANATQTARAMSLLYALTGCFEPRAATCCSRCPRRGRHRRGPAGGKARAPTLGLGERPLGPASRNNVTTRELYRAILRRSHIRSAA